jgi:hypothetical protein
MFLQVVIVLISILASYECSPLPYDEANGNALGCDGIPCPALASCAQETGACIIQCRDGLHFNTTTYRCEANCDEMDCPDNMVCYTSTEDPLVCKAKCVEGYTLSQLGGSGSCKPTAETACATYECPTSATCHEDEGGSCIHYCEAGKQYSSVSHVCSSDELNNVHEDSSGCDGIPCPALASCAQETGACIIQCRDGLHFNTTTYRCEANCDDMDCPDNMVCYTSTEDPLVCKAKCVEGYTLSQLGGSGSCKPTAETVCVDYTCPASAKCHEDEGGTCVYLCESGKTYSAVNHACINDDTHHNIPRCAGYPCPRYASCTRRKIGCNIQCQGGLRFNAATHKCEANCDEMVCPDNMVCFTSTENPLVCKATCADGYTLSQAGGSATCKPTAETACVDYTCPESAKCHEDEGGTCVFRCRDDWVYTNAEKHICWPPSYLSILPKDTPKPTNDTE